MKTYPLMIASMMLVVILSGSPAPVWAMLVRQGDISVGKDNNQRRGYVFDQRYNHNRHYPKRGLRVKELPRGSRFSPYRRHKYYFNDGSWYLPSRSGFSVVMPPIGLTVMLLPPFYTTIWAGSIPYYYADGVYYRWRSEDRVYVVSEPPLENEIIEQSAIPERLFIYPKDGQDEAQQATDRYECHRWSVEQTGFDPTQPGGNVQEKQHQSKHLDYQRAMKSCLEARKYSVQ